MTAGEKGLIKVLREFEESGQSEGRAFAEAILDALGDVDPGEKIEHAEAMANEFIGFASQLLTEARKLRQVDGLAVPATEAPPIEMREAMMRIAHMRCDGDEWFLTPKQVAEDADGADISNDLLQDQMVEVVAIARGALGIQESGPVREPTKVHEST